MHAVPVGWRCLAFNPIPDSDNLIHSDETAREHGFSGALVPGVVLTACLVQPAVEAWGLAWLNRGEARAGILQPVYDGERFIVELGGAGLESKYEATLSSKGQQCAVAEVSLPQIAGQAPRYQGHAMMSSHHETPPASRANMEALMRDGCRAREFVWTAGHDMARYTRQQADIPSLLRTDGQPTSKAYANMAYLLGCANRHFSDIAEMSAWIHMQTHSRNFQAVPLGTVLVSEIEIVELFNKKGHEFADVVVNLFREDDKQCVCQIEQRAIYQLRR